jgi:hypothetical protein
MLAAPETQDFPVTPHPSLPLHIITPSMHTQTTAAGGVDAEVGWQTIMPAKCMLIDIAGCL